MKSTTSILIKTDAKVKQEAQETAKELGLSLSAVLNALLKEFIKTKTIIFSTNKSRYVPNAYLHGLLKKADEDLKKGKVSPKFKTTKEFIEYLHRQAA